ncbi:MAG: hypothetical protein V4702_05375 [Patescibacteria group bacterium]
MDSRLIFGATELNIDPETLKDINAVTLFVYAVLFLALIGLVVWKAAPFIHKERQKSRLAKREAANAIWFDHIESELHCGHDKIRIEPNSFEHFVCKIIFKTPGKYTKDLDIFDEADEAKGVKETKRGVEQAVRRLNKKAKVLGLKEDLFKRSKERTSVNDEYRQRIVNN